MTPEIVKQYGQKVGTHTIEVDVKASGRCPLPVDELLRGKKILAFFVADNPSGNAVTPLGRKLVTRDTLRTSYIDLQQDNDHFLKDHPVYDLIRTEGDDTLRHFNICNLNPSKSEIKIAFDATTKANVVDTSRTFLLTFVYER